MTLCGLTDRMPPQSESIYLGRKWLEGWFVPGAFRDAWGQFQGKRNKILLGDAITGSEELFWPHGGGGSHLWAERDRYTARPQTKAKRWGEEDRGRIEVGAE